MGESPFPRRSVAGIHGTSVRSASTQGLRDIPIRGCTASNELFTDTLIAGVVSDGISFLITREQLRILMLNESVWQRKQLSYIDL